MNDYKTTSVLAVEDNPGDVELIHRYLQTDSTIQLETAESLSTGIQKASKGSFSIVLLDLSLPDSEGLGTIQKFQVKVPELPIVVLTGLKDEQRGKSAVQLGAQDYVVKGDINANALLRVIHYAIERRKLITFREKMFHADRLSMMGQLAAGIAHEVNNPASFVLTNLSVIHEHIQQLESMFQKIRESFQGRGRDVHIELPLIFEGYKASELFRDTREMLGDNREGVKRICAMIKELRSFSRLDDQEIEKINLNDIIEMSCNMIHNEIRHRATLIKDFGDLPWIAGHRRKLIQVISNLLMNAVHAIEEKGVERGHVKIKTKLIGDQNHIIIEDDGTGMTQEVREKIFDPFFTTKSRDKGTGLGLSLCVEMIRMHREEIHVHSEPQKGSQFETMIPRHTGLTVKPIQKSPQVVSTDQRQARVLLIDDESMLLKAMKRIMEPQHRVVLANSGKKALEIIREDAAFDVVLCDLMMPEMDGVVLYDEVRKIRPEFTKRFIFLTGGTFTDRTQKFAADTTNLFLEKPIEKEELFNAIHQIASSMG